MNQSYKLISTVTVAQTSINLVKNVRIYNGVNYAKTVIYGLAPGACTIKLFIDTYMVFCNKLECLSLASLSSLG